MTQPAILFDNRLRVGAVTGTTPSEGSLANLYDWLSYDGAFWNTTGAVQVDLAGTHTCSAAGFAQHNLGTVGATVQIRTGTTVRATYAPPDDRPFLMLFNPLTTTGWNIRISGQSAGPRLNVAALGARMVMDRSAFIGVQPPKINPGNEYAVSRSDTGLVMGRTLLRQGLQNTIAFDNCAENWVYTHWLPLIRHAEKFAFFWAWDVDDHPTDVALVQMVGNPTGGPSSVGGPQGKGRFDVSMEVAGG